MVPDCLNGLPKFTKWREERNRCKLVEKLRSKPPFKAGIVHHRWYSPPVAFTRNGTTKNKQKRENTRNKKNKIIKKVLLAPMDHQSKVPTGFNIESPITLRIAKKGVQAKNYLQNGFDGSVIKFSPQEFDTSTPVTKEIVKIGEDTLSEDQYHMHLLNQETERLFGLSESDHPLELIKNEELAEDSLHLIKECHARFKKFEELEENDNRVDEKARGSFNIANPFIKNASYCRGAN